jgi:hypothetical protein
MVDSLDRHVYKKPRKGGDTMAKKKAKKAVAKKAKKAKKGAKKTAKKRK